MSATNFKVGDVVKMSAIGRKNYKEHRTNPHTLTGIIEDVGGVYVRWSNGELNSYTRSELELIKPKQEQYYTSIPTDVKIGDKFEIISETGYKDEFRWAGSKKFPLGSIVTLDYEIPSDEPRFVNSNGDGTYLNWGCLKPVKDTEYKVGDWVLLINKDFNSHVSDMNKFKGTIQRIGSTNKYSKDIFYLKGDDKMWAFVLSDFVKKVDAPVATAHLADIPPKTLIGRTTESTDVQQFNIGDEVELVEAIKELNVGMRGTIKSVPNDGRGFIDVMINGSLHNIFNRRLKLITGKSNQFSIGDSVYVTQEYIDKRLTGCCPKEKLIINNKIEQNGEVHSNTTGNQSIALHGIPASIICGTIGRGKTISCSRAEIKLGN